MRSRLFLTCLLLPVLAACGDKDGTSSQGNDNPVVVQQPVDIVRAAAENTINAGTARIAMTMEGPGISMTASGVTATKEVKGTMTMTMDAAGQKIDMEMRMLGQVMYMKMPALPAEMTGGKPWIKLDLEELSKRTDIDFQALAQIQQNDPKQALAYIKGVTDGVKETGKEDVRGVATTKYTGTLDMKKAIEAQPEQKVKDAIKGLVDQLGTSTIPMTIWIDAEGRMRKMVQEVDLSGVPAAGGAGGTMTTTFEMYDFGVKLDVQAPPENQVGDGSALLGGG